MYRYSIYLKKNVLQTVSYRYICWSPTYKSCFVVIIITFYWFIQLKSIKQSLVKQLIQYPAKQAFYFENKQNRMASENLITNFQEKKYQFIMFRKNIIFNKKKNSSIKHQFFKLSINFINIIQIHRVVFKLQWSPTLKTQVFLN